MNWREEWLDTFYRRVPGWQDGTTQFHAICRAALGDGRRIIEVGAGPTNPTSAFLATLGEVHGVDVSSEVLENAHLKTASLIEGDRFSHPDGWFDLATSNYVVEHIGDGEAHLREVHRVLKPGGRYAFRTPNLFHYVALVSRFTPHSVHRRLANWLRALPEGSHEPWPTKYVMNTAVSVNRYAGRVGFQVERLELVEKEPSYGLVARPLFLLGLAYERTVNVSDWLAPLRANLFVVLKKPDPKADELVVA